MSERCECCRMEMHRYGFGPGGAPADADKHDPSAVACANMVIGEIHRMRAKTDPDAAAFVLQEIELSVTAMGIYVDRLDNDRKTEAFVRATTA